MVGDEALLTFVSKRHFFRFIVGGVVDETEWTRGIK
jgi:hypothetical protein